MGKRTYRKRARALSVVLDEVISEGTQLGRSRWLLRICRVWDAAVGRDNARYHQPDSFWPKTGLLTVASRSAVHAAALQPYLEEIRKRLNHALGRHVVRRIRTRQSSSLARRRTEPKPQAAARPEATLAADEKAVERLLSESGVSGQVRESLRELLRRQPAFRQPGAGPPSEDR